jgi:hypothetical protein
MASVSSPPSTTVAIPSALLGRIRACDRAGLEAYARRDDLIRLALELGSLDPASVTVDLQSGLITPRLSRSAGTATEDR